jgi:protein-disulfide isomerase
VRAFCALCIGTYALGAGAVLAVWPARRGWRRLGPALRSAEGRLGVAGWTLGTLAVAGAVLGAEAALERHAATRHLTMLGAEPSPDPPRLAGPTPEPAPPPEVEGEPEGESNPPAPAPVRAANTDGSVDWEARARELQATLDDPQKLEEYFSLKARREFDTAKVESIPLENAPLRGPVDAPVKVVEYSDFLCPFCRNLAQGLAQFVPQAGGRVAVYFKNFPLDQSCNERLRSSTHPGACWLALGAVCAHLQGRFDAYHDRVFSAEGLRHPQASDVLRLAEEAGLNAQAVGGCIDDPETRRVLREQIEEAHRLGVRATPTLYVNGKKLPRINEFVAVVDAEARKKGFPALEP